MTAATKKVTLLPGTLATNDKSSSRMFYRERIKGHAIQEILIALHELT